MMKTNLRVKFFLIFCVVLLSGCDISPAKKHIPLSEAHAKFKSIVTEDLGYPLVTFEEGNTLWCYLPIEESLVATKPSARGPVMSNSSKESISVRYADAAYEERKFLVEYDIGIERKYNKDYGYSSSAGDAYQKRQSNILKAIQNAYFDVDAALERRVPDFFVLVIADIKTGLEIESIFYFPDLRQALGAIPSLSMEEYSQRSLTELRGHTAIIGDTTGKHLNIRDITMPEFLAKQIVNRINFKYGRSSFPPSNDTLTELSNIVAATMHAYEFKDYEGIVFTDLDSADQQIVDREKLEALIKPLDQKKGRLINIKFR